MCFFLILSLPSFCLFLFFFFFFFNDTATTEIYTLSLHDALPISGFAASRRRFQIAAARPTRSAGKIAAIWKDRKSTRLNSSHITISYAVFCLKKKKKKKTQINNKNKNTTYKKYNNKNNSDNHQTK